MLNVPYINHKEPCITPHQGTTKTPPKETAITPPKETTMSPPKEPCITPPTETTITPLKRDHEPAPAQALPSLSPIRGGDTPEPSSRAPPPPPVSPLQFWWEALRPGRLGP